MLQRIKGLKAQAAMEFLMTYGWAILVVLIVIGALAYFGVLSPSTLLPEKCTFPVSLTCTDHTVTTNSMTFILLNGAGRDMRVWAVSATSDSLRGALACNCNNSFQGGGAAASVALRNGQSATFSLSGIPTGAGAVCIAGGTPCDYIDTGRDKNRYNVTVYYSWQDSLTVYHTLQGELLARKP